MTGCCASDFARVTARSDGTLQGLRHGSASTLRLRSGATRPVAVEAWIPEGTNDYEGRDVAVELTSTLQGRG